MNITNRTLSLNGTGAALVIPGGATFTTTGSTVIFNGTAAQQAAGIAYNNLTINNTIGLNVTGVTLIGNATVNGVLALTSSDLGYRRIYLDAAEHDCFNRRQRRGWNGESHGWPICHRNTVDVR